MGEDGAVSKHDRTIWFNGMLDSWLQDRVREYRSAWPDIRKIVWNEVPDKLENSLIQCCCRALGVTEQQIDRAKIQEIKDFTSHLRRGYHRMKTTADPETLRIIASFKARASGEEHRGPSTSQSSGLRSDSTMGMGSNYQQISSENIPAVRSVSGQRSSIRQPSNERLLPGEDPGQGGYGSQTMFASQNLHQSDHQQQRSGASQQSYLGQGLNGSGSTKTLTKDEAQRRREAQRMERPRQYREDSNNEYAENNRTQIDSRGGREDLAASMDQSGVEGSDEMEGRFIAVHDRLGAEETLPVDLPILRNLTVFSGKDTGLHMLWVRGVPRQYNTVTNMISHFGRFGRVISALCSPDSKMSLIQFATAKEACAAYSCPTALFGNRFIRIFWTEELKPYGTLASTGLGVAPPLTKKRPPYPGAETEDEVTHGAPPTAAPYQPSTPVLNPGPVPDMIVVYSELKSAEHILIREIEKYTKDDSSNEKQRSEAEEMLSSIRAKMSEILELHPILEVKSPEPISKAGTEGEETISSPGIDDKWLHLQWLVVYEPFGVSTEEEFLKAIGDICPEAKIAAIGRIRFTDGIERFVIRSVSIQSFNELKVKLPQNSVYIKRWPHRVENMCIYANPVLEGKEDGNSIEGQGAESPSFHKPASNKMRMLGPEDEWGDATDEGNGHPEEVDGDEMNGLMGTDSELDELENNSENE